MSLIGQELSAPLVPVRFPGGGHETTGDPRDSDAAEAAALLAAAREVRSVSTSHFPPSTPGLWPVHVHAFHELLWGTQGVLTVETEHGFFAVPPTIGLWIPAGVAHAVQTAGGTGFYCTYVDADVSASPAPPASGEVLADDPFVAVLDRAHRTTAVSVPPAARELMVHLSQRDMAPAARRRSERVVVDLLSPVDVTPMVLPMPSDARLASVARRLLDDPADTRSLEAWAREVSVSVRNFSRLFHRETGMTFAQWRIHARVRVAIGLLAGGMPVGTVGRRVGYRTPSAFVQSFRRVLGHTPGWYVASVRADAEHPLAAGGDDQPVPDPRAWLG
ncbi:AraC family transcriptional regulator [Oerskovia sp. KBS0722]|uniref:helix-turn-helix domain-containing protein n=1 Tax=Oerskovia sp. KBS0722 TaxID=1179673 RepID=UPI00110E2183|nr:AraC family transcriptional regulator [Oerskovia sp. KBS0722]QDW62036.1 helix-turn-helix transcriptional regulator [Oerskovia sp. KBS0722]